MDLSWNKNPLDVINKYIIKYKSINGCPDTPFDSITINGTLKKYTIRNLEENMTYNISIRVRNSNNTMSDNLIITTLPNGEYYIHVLHQINMLYEVTIPLNNILN